MKSDAKIHSNKDTNLLRASDRSSLFLKTIPPGSPDGSAWFGIGVLPLFDDLYSIDPNMMDAGRILMWFFESSMIFDRGRIENHQVSFISDFKQTSILNF